MNGLWNATDRDNFRKNSRKHLASYRLFVEEHTIYSNHLTRAAQSQRKRARALLPIWKGLGFILQLARKPSLKVAPSTMQKRRDD